MMLEIFNLTGKTAIVTGAGRGIGRAIAIGLAEAGANIVLVSRTEEQFLAVEQLISDVVNKFGKVDILVNNAGINYKNNFLGI